MEIDQILEQVPQSLQALTENHQNLLNVAEYCSDNYFQACGGSVALEQTKVLLTQSLASVAFQISSVSSSLLRLLELQGLELKSLESSVLLLGQSVEMHREKVARRDIGGFTTSRRVPRCHKLLPPAEVQPRPPYSRQPINFQQLDAIGHGVKVGVKAERSGTIRKLGSSFRNKPPEPVQCPTAPPAVGSFGKPVAPPSIPSSWQAPPPCEVIDEPLPPYYITDEAPPLAAANESPDEAEDLPPPPPLPPTNDSPAKTLDLIGSSEAVAPPPPPEAQPTLLATPPTPHLETVLEDVSFPPPPVLPEETAETLTPPPEVRAETLPPPPPLPIPEENDLEIPPPPPPPPPFEIQD